MTVTIAYLVHDLNDAAVARRVRMLVAGGGTVRLAGFSRGAAPDMVAGVAATSLGRTGDARMIQRVLAVLRNVARAAPARHVATGADVLVARNLEMLAIAARVRRPGQQLVYECLDIHRLMLGDGAKSRALRALEGQLLQGCDLIITSAPAFADTYFRDIQHHAGAIRLVENKVLAIDGTVAATRSDLMPRAPGAPWRIGWFGMLRCATTLAMLTTIVREGAGQVEVLIAGKPARTEFEDFDRDVAAVPGLRYIGPYTAADLRDLYGQVDFVWSVDFFEEGLNSRWLLPNRLYEGLAFGAVPLSMPGIAIAEWLEANGVGVLFGDMVAEVPPFLRGLDDADYARLRVAVRDVPDERLVTDRAECAALVAAMAEAA